jgi:fatty-acyl-CoA synthase
VWIRVRAGHSLSVSELQDYCKQRIAHYKVPQYVHFTDTYPLTVTGKVQKHIMRQQSIALFNLKDDGMIMNNDG